MKKSLRLVSLRALLMIAVIFGCISEASATPKIENLNISYQLWNNGIDDYHYFNLMFMIPGHDDFDGDITWYYEHIATGDTGVVEIIDDSIYTRDTMFFYDQSFPKSKFAGGGYYMWLGVTDGNMYGEISNKVYVEIAGDSVITEHIAFSNKPSGSAYVDENYYYDANVTTNSDDNVVFALGNAPEGMTIDESTGEVNWVPETKGRYTFNIKAYLENNPSVIVSKTYNIMVYQCRVNGVLILNVVDENGDPIEYGKCEIYANMDERYGVDSLVYQDEGNIKDGYLFIGLDAGEYYLYLNGLNDLFYDEWYEDKNSYEDADSVEIGCGDSTVITVVVKRIVKIKEYYITGRVIDAGDETHIAYAGITFFGYDPLNGDKKNYTTHSDYNGLYSIKLPENYVYKAYAYITDSINAENNYLPQFYNDADDPLTATMLSFEDSDINGVDFLLTTGPDYDNAISGAVVDIEENPIGNSFVVAYIIKNVPWGEQELYIGRTQITNSRGEFTIENLHPGQYVLFVYPGSYEFAPGYYMAGEPVVEEWTSAWDFSVEEDGVAGPLTVILERTRGMYEGNGGIRGKVLTDGGVIKSGDDPLAGNPLNGAIIYVTDADGNVVSYTDSDVDGSYEMTGIKKGVYTMIVDRIGYSNASKSIEFETDDAVLEEDFSLRVEEVESVEELLSGSLEIEITPNPATHFIKLEFAGTQGISGVSIVNMNGDIVLTKQFNTVNGLNTLNMSTLELPSGRYIISIINKNQLKSTSFEVVR